MGEGERGEEVGSWKLGEDGVFSLAGSDTQVNAQIYPAAIIQLRSVRAGRS